MAAGVHDDPAGILVLGRGGAEQNKSVRFVKDVAAFAATLTH